MLAAPCLQPGGDAEQLDEAGLRGLVLGGGEVGQPAFDRVEERVVVTGQAGRGDLREQAFGRLGRRVGEPRGEALAQRRRPLRQEGAGTEKRQHGGERRQLAAGKVERHRELGARRRVVAALAGDTAGAHRFDAGDRR